MVASYVPERGDLIKVNFDPSAGHEQAGWRPALVLSPTSYNGKTHLVIVVPVTNQRKGYPFEIVLPANLKTTGVILADQIKCLDWKQRSARLVESVPRSVLEETQEKLGLLLGMKVQGG